MVYCPVQGRTTMRQTTITPTNALGETMTTPLKLTHSELLDAARTHWQAARTREDYAAEVVWLNAIDHLLDKTPEEST